MIHILLLILKIIGILLLALLAVILALLLVLLFAPVRCTVEAAIDNTPESAEGVIRFHWLFNLLAGEAAWRDGKFSWKFRAAWKKFSDEEEPDPAPDPDPDQVSALSSAPVSAPAPAERSIKNEDAPAAGTVRTDVSSGSGGSPSGHSETAAGNSDEERVSRIKRFTDRIKSSFRRIKYTFQHLYDKIKALNHKKEYISRFLSNEIHKKAFSRLLREIRGLLRRLRPRRAAIDITFGFEDPSTTGYTLAGISLIYPVIGEYTNLTPDFEHRVLKGNLFIREKIRLVYFLIFAWNMLLDRNVRTTYRHLRKFKL